MTAYTNFNKKNLKELRAKIEKSLREAGIEGVEFNLGNIRFSEHDCKIELMAKIVGKKTQSEAAIENIAQIMGLKVRNAKGDELVEYKSRNWKYPFVYVSGSDGHRYKCDEKTAERLFAA